MLPTITTPALAVETGGPHQRQQQRQQQGQGQEKEIAEIPSLRGVQEEPQQQQEPPPPQQQHEQGQKEKGPALFPPPNNPATNNTTPSSSSNSCPKLEELVDRFFAQARGKFAEQFDEMAQTMSVSMKAELGLQAERERQSRAEWEVLMMKVHKQEVDELRANRDQLVVELDMVRMPMIETPSMLRSGLLFMSGSNPRNPCGTPAVAAGQPLRTPASRLSLFFSSSSSSREIDVEATPSSGMTPLPFRGLFSQASVKPVPSPLMQQPPRLKPQPQPQPSSPPPPPPPQQQQQQQSNPLPSEASAANIVATTSPDSSSASGSIDVTAMSANEMSPSPFRGLFPTASAIKPVPSPLVQQPPQLQPQPQSQPSPSPPQQQQQQQSNLLPSEVPAVGIVATTSPVYSRSATPSSVQLTGARTAAYEGACSSTSNHAAAAAAAAAAQSSWLSTYYSGNSKSMAPSGPAPASSPVLASASSIASATPAAIASSVDTPPTIDPIIATLDEHHPMGEIAPHVSKTVRQPEVTKAAAPPPPASVTTAAARGVVSDGGVVVKGCEDATVIATSTTTAAVATIPGGTPPPPFGERLSSVGRRSSMPVGGLSRRRTSVPAGLSFSVFNDSMPPPQPRTPCSAKKTPMGFGANPTRSPLGEVRVNSAATRLSPAVNVGDIKKADVGGIKKAAGGRDTSKDNETVWDGKRQASAISASPRVSSTKKENGDVVDTSPSPRKSSNSIETKRAKKVLPKSQRVLRSASRDSRKAEVATGATAGVSKQSPPRTSTAEASWSRSTRSATLRSAGRASGRRGSFMKF